MKPGSTATLAGPVASGKSEYSAFKAALAPSAKPRVKPHTIVFDARRATERPATVQSAVTPAGPEPATVRWLSVTDAADCSHPACTPAWSPVTVTLASSASPPRTRIRPATAAERRLPPASSCSAGAAPPSSRSSVAREPGSCRRSAGTLPATRSTVTPAPRPTTRTGRPGASVNVPASFRRPSRIVSTAASWRAAEKARAAVSTEVQPDAWTPTQ